MLTHTLFALSCAAVLLSYAIARQSKRVDALLWWGVTAMCLTLAYITAQPPYSEPGTPTNQPVETY